LNGIYLDNTALPVICAVDSRTAGEPFTHADRILDFNVLVYVTEGAIYVTEDGTDYEIEPGSLLFLKHGIRHFGKRENPKGTKWIFVHFYLEDSALPEHLPDSSDIGVYERLERSLLLPKQLFGLKGSGIERMLSELAAYSHGQDPAKRFRLNLMFSQVLSEIALYGSSEPSLADRIAAYLERTGSEPFSAQALEREFFLSYKRLASVFKNAKGVSMQNYHTTLRLGTAARLLRTTDQTVSEIAEAVGFSDALYFSRRFKDQFSLSPREYRKSMSLKY